MIVDAKVRIYIFESNGCRGGNLFDLISKQGDEFWQFKLRWFYFLQYNLSFNQVFDTGPGKDVSEGFNTWLWIIFVKLRVSKLSPCSIKCTCWSYFDLIRFHDCTIFLEWLPNYGSCWNRDNGDDDDRNHAEDNLYSRMKDTLDTW